MTDAICTRPENDSVAMAPMATPTSAVMMGNDAARSDPSTTTRTIAAIATPMASPTPRISGTPWEISVLKATSTPATGSAVKCSTTASFDASASSSRG